MVSDLVLSYALLFGASVALMCAVYLFFSFYYKYKNSAKIQKEVED